MKIILILIFITSVSATFAQTKKLRWETEACSFESIYDAKKCTAAELNGTRKLLTMDFFPEPR